MIKFFSPVAGFDAGAFLSVAYELNIANGDRTKAVAELNDQRKKAKELYEKLLDDQGDCGCS